MPAAHFAIQAIDRQVTAPVAIGTGFTAAGNSSITITTSAAIPVGALVCVAVQLNKSSTISVSSISDGTNSYSVAKSVGWDTNTFAEAALWYKENAAAVASSSTITVTLSTTTSGNESQACAFYFPGQQVQTGSLDKTAGASTGASAVTGPSSGASAALSQTEEIVVGFFGGYGSAASNPSVSNENGFTLITNASHDARMVVHAAYKFQNNSTTAATYAPTFSTTVNGGCGVATFKA